MDDGAALMAAKAIIQLTFGIDAERRGLLVMERAASPESLALLLQGHIFPYDFLYGNPGTQIIEPSV